MKICGFDIGLTRKNDGSAAGNNHAVAMGNNLNTARVNNLKQ